MPANREFENFTHACTDKQGKGFNSLLFPQPSIQLMRNSRPIPDSSHLTIRFLSNSPFGSNNAVPL